MLDQKYFWFDSAELGKGSLKYYCEEWAESIGGGHNTYYRYGFKRVKHPPIGELEKMIRAEKEGIKACKKQLDILYETLNKIKKTQTNVRACKKSI